MMQGRSSGFRVIPGHRAFPSSDSGNLPVPVAGYSGGSAADLHRFPNAPGGVFSLQEGI
jgi:hypothetical protein